MTQQFADTVELIRASLIVQAANTTNNIPSRPKSIDSISGADKAVAYGYNLAILLDSAHPEIVGLHALKLHGCELHEHIVINGFDSQKTAIVER